MAFFIKYEFWRNYIDVLYHQEIPVYSVSSIFRENQIFFRPYGYKYARVLRRITHLFVQNEASRELLKRLGVTQVSVVGDTRFDRVIDIRRQARELPVAEAATRQGHVIVAGSTWPPDEDILIPYFNSHPDCRLILAPHVVSEDHLREIEQKLQRPALRYSQATPESAAKADCLLIDGYGLLSSIYRYATVAYVGGGFGVGIHNVPEAGGCFEIHSADDFNRQADRLFADAQALTQAGQAAGRYISNNAGATDAVFSVVRF